MRARIVLVGVVAAVILVTGCKRNSSPDQDTALPFSCYRFGESLWEEFRFDKDSPEDVMDKAAELWGIDRKLVRSGIHQGQFLVEWNDVFSEFAYYSARFEAGRLIGITAYWERFQPPLGRVIECLGEPDYYDSVFYIANDETGVGLSLWYGSKGLVVGSSSSNSVDYQPAGFEPEYPMTHMTIVSPSAAIQMLPRVYVVVDDAEGQAFMRCAMKSWPGSVEALQIQSEEEYSSCMEAGQEG